MAVGTDGDGLAGPQCTGIRFLRQLLILNDLPHDKINDRDQQHRHKESPANQHEPEPDLEKKDEPYGQQYAFEQNILQSVSSAPCGS